MAGHMSDRCSFCAVGGGTFGIIIVIVIIFFSSKIDGPRVTTRPIATFMTENRVDQPTDNWNMAKDATVAPAAPWSATSVAAEDTTETLHCYPC